ncbi:MAG: hypothetical protein Q8Q49_01725, partial [bacterium]|nr:hypothetical protein [bacterium]
MSATQESGQTPTIDLPRSPSVDPEGYFATLPEPSLRLVLIGFERDVVSQTHGLFANEEAARVCIGYANTHVARTQNPFGVVTPETLSPEQVSFFAHRLADWVSTQEIVRFTPQYVAPGRFKKSVDVNSLRPYGALAWEMMHNLSSSWGVHGKIARKKMYDSLIAHIGDHPIGDYVRKPGIRIEHFSRSYQEQLHSLRSAVKGDSVREPAPAPKSETRKQFTGS